MSSPPLFHGTLPTDEVGTHVLQIWCASCRESCVNSGDHSRALDGDYDGHGNDVALMDSQRMEALDTDA